MQQGDHLTLSTLHSTVHLGTHIDGPCHYVKDALAWNPCRCRWGMAPRWSLMPPERAVPASVLPEGDLPPRLLVRTQSHPDPNRFNPKYRPMSPAFMDAIADRGVQLIGVDTPSVDASDAKSSWSAPRRGAWSMDLGTTEAGGNLRRTVAFDCVPAPVGGL